MIMTFTFLESEGKWSLHNLVRFEYKPDSEGGGGGLKNSLIVYSVSEA